MMQPRGCCSCIPFTDIPILMVFIGFFIGMIYVFGVRSAGMRMLDNYPHTAVRAVGLHLWQHEPVAIRLGASCAPEPLCGAACSTALTIVVMPAAIRTSAPRTTSTRQCLLCLCPEGALRSTAWQYWANPLYYSSMGSICLDSCPSGNTSESVDTSTIYCTCNNQLTIGRTDSDTSSNSVANSLNSTDFMLGKASECIAHTHMHTRFASAAARVRGAWH